MRRIFWLAALMIFTPALVLASEWHPRDLYYYDADGRVAQLNLAPKLLIRFKKDLTAGERALFFSEFSPVAQKPESNGFSVMLEFSASTTPPKLLEMANKASLSGVAEAVPIFLVENIEAVLEGIVVEPKTIVTDSRLYERMKKYGDFSPKQIISENGTFVFLIDEISPPLNLLVFANLIQNDSWVRHAYPRFRFLHDPIIANLTVEPVSGTVGEVRTITFTIKIFDPAITLSENELPEFGKGLFMPMQKQSYPPGYLFELLGDAAKLPIKLEKRSRTYTISWKFRHYALGEWTVPPQPISYVKNGVPQEIVSSNFTFIVNSQIGNLNITDMPFPHSLIYSSQTPEVISETALPPIPSYWFDRWISSDNYLIRYAGLASALLGALGVGVMGILLIKIIGRTYSKKTSYRRLTKQIEDILSSAQNTRSYADYAEALSLILTALFPHLSSRPTWEEIKDDTLVREKLGVEMMKTMEETFYELERRYSRNPTATTESLAMLDKNIRRIREVV